MIKQAVAAAVMIILDRVVKLWASDYLAAAGSMDFLPGILRLTYSENRGMAFGLLPEMRWIFVTLTILVLAFIALAFVRKWVTHPFERWALVFVAGGAVGNLIDRIYQGYVVDIFEFEFVSFAIFNVADIFVTAGGIMICAYFIFRPDWKVKKNDETV